MALPGLGSGRGSKGCPQSKVEREGAWLLVGVVEDDQDMPDVISPFLIKIDASRSRTSWSGVCRMSPRSEEPVAIMLLGFVRAFDPLLPARLPPVVPLRHLSSEPLAAGHPLHPLRR